MPKPNSNPTPVSEAKGQSYNRIMVSKSGSEQLRFSARETKDGEISSYIFHSTIDADGKRARGKGRGASMSHKGFKLAKDAIESQMDQAKSSGWLLKERSSGVRKDAFDLDSLPKAK